VGEAEYSNRERMVLAGKKQALPDGSFPIADRRDLEKAIHLWGNAKDPTRAKAHILTRAKALGAEDLIPKNWGAA
jgi:hypothetical protein